MYNDLFLSMFIFDQCSSADIVFLWFVYANITLETVALDTPNNVAVFITAAPAKRALTVCSL
jgi:hypothetical protein